MCVLFTVSQDMRVASQDD